MPVKKKKPLGPEDLEKLGQILYGNQWKTELAQALELSSVRRIHQWTRGERKIPPELWNEIFELVRLHEYDLDRLLTDLQSRLPDAT